MDVSIKEAIENVQKTFHDFKALNDEAQKKQGDVLLAMAVDKANAAVSESEAKLRGLFEKLEAKVNLAGLGGALGTSEENKARAEHRKGFSNYFRKGAEAGLKTLEIQASLSSGSDADGGFTVPYELDTNITRIMAKYCSMRAIATVRTIGASNYKKIVNLAGNQSGWVGETDSRPNTNTPKLSELDFPAMTLYSNPAATQDMLDDSMIDVESWLADEVGIDFGEKEGLAFISGNGVKQPRGLLAYPVVANASYTWGSVGYIPSGAAGALQSSPNQVDCLLDLIHAVKRGYRQNASFLMNTTTLGAIRKAKTTYGDYLYTPTIVPDVPATFFGYPIFEDDNMPSIAANSYSIAFGDFAQGYVIVDRLGARVIRDAFTNKPYVQFYTTKRVGGGIQKFEAIKLLKFATS